MQITNDIKKSLKAKFFSKYPSIKKIAFITWRGKKYIRIDDNFGHWAICQSMREYINQIGLQGWEVT